MAKVKTFKKQFKRDQMKEIVSQFGWSKRAAKKFVDKCYKTRNYGKDKGSESESFNKGG